jgi:hypothetical protein
MRFGVDADQKARTVEDDGGNVLAFEHRRAHLRRPLGCFPCSRMYARISL